jgi:glycine cleavage system H lipoate-binding protein
MQSVIEILQSAGALAGGMLARFGLVLALLAVAALPAVLIAAAIRRAGALRRRALGIREVAGVPFRDDLHYAPGHLWIRRRPGGALEVGLDGIAQQLLPAVTSIEGVRPGTRVSRGEPIAVVRAGDRALTVLAPVDGVVAGVNAAAVRDPALVKREGCGRGWVAALAPADESFASLPRGQQAEEWTRREALRFARFLEDRLGFAGADGGALVAPAPWLMGDDGWRALVDAFLRPS